MAVIQIVLILSVLYLYLKWHYSYWYRRGLEYLKPTLIFGNTRDYALRKISFIDQFNQLYNQLKAKGAKHGGIFLMLQPTYLPVDLDIIKNILQRDFHYFESRGIYSNEEVDPLTGHLFNLDGDKWKMLRGKMTPAFTTGKLKMMLSTILACTENLKDVLKQSTSNQTSIDIKQLASSFTIESIGNIGFGLDVNSLKNPNCEFRQFGLQYFEGHTMTTLMKILISLVFPRHILIKFGYKVTPSCIEDFFLGVVKNTVEYREKTNAYRKDFMHSLLQLKNRGKLSDESSFSTLSDDKGEDFITINELAAQCFIFFLAGYETSASTLTFALLELAINQEVQNKLRYEVMTVLNAHDGQINYEGLMEMKYLDKVFNETFRKYAPGVGAMRICTKPYNIPDTNVTLEVGTRVIIPFKAIQWDPEHYPNPEIFDPERFNEKNTMNRHPVAFMPFGEGKRKCIGWRLGMLQLKAGLVTIIKNFQIVFNDKTILPVKYSIRSITPNVDGAIWLDFKEL